MNFIEKKLNDSITITGIVNLHFFEFPKDFYTKTDTHSFFELIYVSSGHLHIKSDTYTGRLEKEQLIIHYPNEAHSLSCDENSAPTVIIIGFSCSYQNLNMFSSSPTNLTSVEIKNLAEIIKEGRNVFAPPYDVPTYDMKKKGSIFFGSEQILKNMLESFLIRIIRKNNEHDNLHTDSSTEKVAISEITRYLDQNFTEKVTINELAFLFNTNRSTLCKEFKNYTGRTIIEYISDKKLEKAKQYLSTTNKTITVISEELGFETIHYFTRFFKKETGLSPYQYRKKSK